VLPLRRDLAEAFAAFFSESLAVPGAKAFPGMWKRRGAEMLRKDLDAAGIDWHEDEAGTIIDFHSLRHTFGTMLAASGVHPKTAQDLMRHSSIDLTMNLYTHTLIGDRAKATATLPDFSQNEAAVRTGTDDLPSDVDIGRQDEWKTDAEEGFTGTAAQKEGDLQGHLQGQNWQKSPRIWPNRGSGKHLFPKK
jgi:hypothetical protein